MLAEDDEAAAEGTWSALVELRQAVLSAAVSSVAASERVRPCIELMQNFPALRWTTEQVIVHEPPVFDLVAYAGGQA